MQPGEWSLGGLEFKTKLSERQVTVLRVLERNDGIADSSKLRDVMRDYNAHSLPHASGEITEKQLRRALRSLEEKGFLVGYEANGQKLLLPTRLYADTMKGIHDFLLAQTD